MLATWVKTLYITNGQLLVNPWIRLDSNCDYLLWADNWRLIQFLLLWNKMIKKTIWQWAISYCLKLLFQNEAKCWEAINMKIIFRSRANNSDFHNKGFCTKPRFERQFWNSEMAYFPHRAITVEFWGNWGWFFENERKKDRRRYTRKPAVSLLIGSVNLVVVADCLVFRLLIFHFKFYSLTTLKSNIFSSFHNF